MSIEELFDRQSSLQLRMFNKETPIDSVEDFKYSILALIGELGEVLEADKRWKNIRSCGCNKEEKLDELDDCMAFLVNAILYSGFSAEEFSEAFRSKNIKNFERLVK